MRTHCVHLLLQPMQTVEALVLILLLSIFVTICSEHSSPMFSVEAILPTKMIIVWVGCIYNFMRIQVCLWFTGDFASVFFSRYFQISMQLIKSFQSLSFGLVSSQLSSSYTCDVRIKILFLKFWLLLKISHYRPQIKLSYCF